VVDGIVAAMGSSKPSKWEQKQAAAKAAAAKFDANQRLAKHAKATGMAADVDAMGDALGDVLGDNPGVLGWVVAHRKTLIGIGVVLLAGGIVFGICMGQRHALRTTGGQPRGELFVASKQGGTLVVIDYVAVGGGKTGNATAKGQRLTAIDAETGKELAVDVTNYEKCWAGETRAVCVDVWGGLDLLDPRTLEVTHSAKDMIAEAKLAKPTRRHEREGANFIVVLEDGRGARIDTTTFAVTVVESVQSSYERPVSSSCETENHFKEGGTTWRFQGGGTRERLTSDPPPPSESATPTGPALMFLEPEFLRTEPRLPLVLHAATTEKRYTIVSRVDGISKEKWQTPLGGACRRAWVAGPNLIVATESPEQRGIALDLASGRVVWTFGR
jgi:hypothetical protein